MESIENSKDKKKSEEKIQRQKAIVVIHPDGFIHVYGPDTLDVIVRISPVVTCKRGEIAAEEYIEATLPRVYREFYWPNCIRVTGQIRRILPSDIANTKTLLQISKRLTAFMESQNEARKASQKQAVQS